MVGKISEIASIIILRFFPNLSYLKIPHIIVCIIRDRLQIFVSNSYSEFVALYDIDTIFYKPHTN